MRAPGPCFCLFGAPAGLLPNVKPDDVVALPALPNLNPEAGGAELAPPNLKPDVAAAAAAAAGVRDGGRVCACVSVSARPGGGAWNQAWNGRCGQKPWCARAQRRGSTWDAAARGRALRRGVAEYSTERAAGVAPRRGTALGSRWRTDRRVCCPAWAIRRPHT